MNPEHLITNGIILLLLTAPTLAKVQSISDDSPFTIVEKEHSIFGSLFGKLSGAWITGNPSVETSIPQGSHLILTVTDELQSSNEKFVLCTPETDASGNLIAVTCPYTALYTHPTTVVVGQTYATFKIDFGVIRDMIGDYSYNLLEYYQQADGNYYMSRTGRPSDSWGTIKVHVLDADTCSRIQGMWGDLINSANINHDTVISTAEAASYIAAHYAFGDGTITRDQAMALSNFAQYGCQITPVINTGNGGGGTITPTSTLPPLPSGVTPTPVTTGLPRETLPPAPPQQPQNSQATSYGVVGLLVLIAVVGILWLDKKGRK